MLSRTRVALIALAATGALVAFFVIRAASIGPNATAGSPGAASLDIAGSQLWTQDSADIAGVAEASDAFGGAVAFGDFDGDHRADLAIGSPDETVGMTANGGAVNVIYSAGTALSAVGSQLWTQEAFSGVSETGDKFGAALAAGDFNNDGFDDLAVGIPGQLVGAATGAGRVQVIYGSSTGLGVSANQKWDQDVASVLGTAQGGDAFGSALAAGDFNGDSRDDLAVGVPGELVGTADDAGGVNVLLGSEPDGLTAFGNQLWDQDSTNITDSAEMGDRFGWSLAAGDFNGDVRDDLAIGVPNEDAGAVADAGSAAVLYGASGAGLTATGSQLWSQDSAGVLDDAEANDLFGWTVAAADFNADGSDELAVGVPGESIGADASAGIVQVLHGSAGGLSDTDNQLVSQEGDLVAGEVEPGDMFGYALAARDFDGNGQADLAIGVPFDDAGTVSDAGAVNVVYGSTVVGLVAAGNQLFDQATAGIDGEPETGDGFGLALAGGDVDGNGTADLAIGVPGDVVGTEAGAGAVEVLYGVPSQGGPTATPPRTPTPTATFPPLTIGDVDCTGTITSIDAALLLQLAAGLIGTLPCPGVADVNDDGAVDSVDAALILQFVAGLIDTLPP